MIATMSVEELHLDESISTSRFAQRVAMIRNQAELNEQLDPALMISKLQEQNKVRRQSAVHFCCLFCWRTDSTF
jgi:kinesin family protein 6/9